MAKKKTEVPQYGTVMRKGIPYYRTRILDADGKATAAEGMTGKGLPKESKFRIIGENTDDAVVHPAEQ